MPTRHDGRELNELRPITIQTDLLDNPLGHALISFGNTKVLCVASVDESVPRWMRDEGRGWLTAEYSMLPGSTHTRSRRERSRIGGRTSEIQRLIGRSLRAVVDFEALGERTITVDCDVLQADGGTRTASITGAYVALSLAIRALQKKGLLETNPIKSPVAAVSVGILEDAVHLDLPYVEDSAAEVDMNVVMTDGGRLIEVQGTAEGQTFTPAQLTDMVASAQAGIEQLFKAQELAIRNAIAQGE